MKVGSITTDIIRNGLVFNIDPANRASTIPSTSTLKTFNTIDLSQSGSIVTDATWEAGSPPTFDFDGSDGYIDFGNPTELQFTDSFSISGWFKSSSSTSQRIVSKDDATNRSYFVQIATNGSVEASVYTSNTQQKNTSASGLADGNFHHFVFTFENGVGTKLYIDNGTPTTDSFANSIDNDSADFEIGRRGFGDKYFNGNIGPTQIYNRALSANEVLHNYNALKGRFGL